MPKSYRTKITDPQKTLDEGKLQCDLIDVVMGKTGKHADKSKPGKTIESDVTLESVTEKFTEGLFADDEVDIVPSESSQATVPSESSQAKVSTAFYSFLLISPCLSKALSAGWR